LGLIRGERDRVIFLGYNELLKIDSCHENSNNLIINPKGI
jgi:hypothetical protein